MRRVNCTLGAGKSEADYLFVEMGNGWWSCSKLDTPSLHVIDTRRRRCDCPGYLYSKPTAKGCRHLTHALVLEAEMPEQTVSAALAVPTADRETAIAAIIVKGNLAMLSEAEKAEYYLQVCRACDLNPATRPFDFISLKGGKLVLYALKSCAEQLRKRDNVTITILRQDIADGLFMVSVKATLPNGRSDEDLAAATITGLTGEDRSNAIMKTITKAKRRVTLSLCGLGMLEESQVEQFRGQQQSYTPPQFEQQVLNAAVTISAHSLPSETPAMQLTEAQQDRFATEVECLAIADRLGFGDKFESHLRQLYHTNLIGVLTTEQIAELHGRLCTAERKAREKAGAA